MIYCYIHAHKMGSSTIKHMLWSEHLATPQAVFEVPNISSIP